jgi:transposase
MGEYSEAFVAFDVAKAKHAVAIAESGREGEIRFFGEIENTPAAIERTIKKLSGRYDRLHVCYEAGPTGYGLYRQIRELDHDCMVVAPALIPQRPGERVKTNRRDAVTLARLHRAGELTGVWVPDAIHEAIRDLVRAREATAADLRRKRQQLLSSCCATADFIRPVAITGPKRIGAGSLARASSTRRNRSSSRKA